MTDTRLWDRAALPAPADGRRRAEVAALQPGVPTLAELFDFMRDAELRFATLRVRIEELTHTALGETRTEIDLMLRHPGAARVTSGPADDPTGRAYEVWVSDGELVRTYAAAHRLGTQRPIRNRPRGLEDRDFPGTAKVYLPLTPLPAETLPDTFIHPAGFCQNVLATGECEVRDGGLVDGRDTLLVTCLHPRTTELAGDRPDFRIELVVDRGLGIILRLQEWLGAENTRDARVTALSSDGPLPPTAFDFVFPSGTTMLY